MQRKPLNHDRLFILNLGLGRDSTTLLCMLEDGTLRAIVDGEWTVIEPRDVDAVIFSDTGREWDHSYAQIPRLRALVESMGSDAPELIVLAKGDGAIDDPKARPASMAQIQVRAKSGAYHILPDIMSDFGRRSTVVSLQAGDCTGKHKIGPVRKAMNDISLLRFGLNNRSWGALVRSGKRRPHINIIGIAADERSRVDNGPANPVRFTSELYPLIDMGINKADEAPILAAHGFDDVRKSGCYMCPYQPLGWYWALSVTDPAAFAEVESYENKSMDRNAAVSINGNKYPKKAGADLAGQCVPIGVQVAKWRAANPAATVSSVIAKEYSRCMKTARAAHKLDRAMVAGDSGAGTVADRRNSHDAPLVQIGRASQLGLF